jgi:hypothetical protein
MVSALDPDDALSLDFTRANAEPFVDDDSELLLSKQKAEK